MKYILWPFKIPLLALRELLVLILKYGYGCRIDIPAGLTAMGNEQWRRK